MGLPCCVQRQPCFWRQCEVSGGLGSNFHRGVSAGGRRSENLTSVFRAHTWNRHLLWTVLHSETSKWIRDRVGFPIRGHKASSLNESHTDVILWPPSQDCPSTHDLLNSLRQVEKMLAGHEASYQQGLRSLRRKMTALHNSTMAMFKTHDKTGEETWYILI